jgi:hypothetical protein
MPINNPYAARLEEERRNLLRRKTGLKRFLEKAPFLISDSVDLRNSVRNCHNELRYIEREYERVCFALGRDPRPPVVRLNAPPVRSAAPRNEPHQQRRLNEVRRSIEGGPYLTRALSGR